MSGDVHVRICEGLRVRFPRATLLIISGASKELLETIVKPMVEKFLKERGLELSQEKTKITHIEEGFDFLGFNVRKYNGKLLIKPAKANIKKFLRDIQDIIKSNWAAKTDNLIYLLNPKIRGWANYYRHVVSSKIFSKVDDVIYHALDRWMRKRHTCKGKRWLKANYFRTRNFDRWQFFAKVKKCGKPAILDLIKANRIHIRRHVKIQGKAHPYNPDYNEYFIKREVKRKANRQFISLLSIIPDGSKALSFKGSSRVRLKSRARFLEDHPGATWGGYSIEVDSHTA